ALERFLGSHLDHRAMLEVIKTWPTPTQLRKAGRARVDAKLAKHGARRHRVWSQERLQALAEQTGVVAVTEAAGLVLPHLAAQLAEYHVSRADIADRIRTIALRHPMHPLLTSLPGRSFTSAAALASYAGLVPVTRQPGTSIKSDTVSRSGNKRLKRALFLSAFASLRSDPVSRVYYDRKRDQGNPIIKPSSPLPIAESVSYSPCSEMAPSISRNPPINLCIGTRCGHRTLGRCRRVRSRANYFHGTDQPHLAHRCGQPISGGASRGHQRCLR